MATVSKHTIRRKSVSMMTTKAHSEQTRKSKERNVGNRAFIAAADRATTTRAALTASLSLTGPAGACACVCAFTEDVEVETKRFGKLSVDVAYGGTFYAITSAPKLGMDLRKTSLRNLVDAAVEITEAAKSQISVHHPESPDLAFIYGTILTDGKDSEIGEPTENICVFANREVDRSPTGSGVCARIAVQIKRGFISVQQPRVFLGVTRLPFTGKAVRECKCGKFDGVIVEVSGNAYYTGEHIFRLEKKDPLCVGFLLSD